MKAGHPCYFVGFLPEPMPGQTIETHRARRGGLPREGHRAASGGRRQALRDRQLPGRLGGDDARRAPARAVRPDHHRRLAAVLLGGRARQVSDALLRRAARRQLADRARPAISAPASSTAPGWCRISRTRIPSNTLWTKQYNLYSKIDTEAERYLDFERWWGGHVNLNAEEIQFIVDELFVGNNLAAGRIKTSDGTDDRPAQHPLADRGVLLEGRQHHPAAAGARLDPRSLRRRRRDPLLRADHRLHRPRERRPPRHLRLGRRRPEGARRVLQQHRPDRRAAARPLRGDASRPRGDDDANADLVPATG